MNPKLKLFASVFSMKAQGTEQEGQKISADQMAELNSKLTHPLPDWFTALYTRHPLSGARLYFHPDAFEGVLDGEMTVAFATPDGIYNETERMIPGSSIKELGYFCFALDAEGSGDHFFIKNDEGDDPPVYRISHELHVEDGKLDEDDVTQVAESLSEFIAGEGEPAGDTTFDTEGVLIIANVTKCKAYYADKEYDYRYAEGLEGPIRQGIIHIVTTQETVEKVQFAFGESEIDADEWGLQESYNYLDVAGGDEVRLISHALFTDMCDSHKGDFDATMEDWLKVRSRIGQDTAEERQDLLDKCPLVELPPGLHRVKTYTGNDVGESGFPQFTFLFEKVDSVDPDRITLEPIECYD